MKKFINKITRGSKLALLLEIMLLVQIILYARIYITRPECASSPYPGNISMGDDYYDN